MKPVTFMAFAVFSIAMCLNNSYCFEGETMNPSISELEFYCSEKGIIMLSMNKLKALTVAYNSQAAQKIPIDDYDVFIEERPEIYLVYFLVKNRPQGLRGTTPGFPEPNFEIEKNSFEIRRIYHTR